MFAQLGRAACAWACLAMVASLPRVAAAAPGDIDYTSGNTARNIKLDAVLGQSFDATGSQLHSFGFYISDCSPAVGINDHTITYQLYLGTTYFGTALQKTVTVNLPDGFAGYYAAIFDYPTTQGDTYTVTVAPGSSSSARWCVMVNDTALPNAGAGYDAGQGLIGGSFSNDGSDLAFKARSGYGDFGIALDPVPTRVAGGGNIDYTATVTNYDIEAKDSIHVDFVSLTGATAVSAIPSQGSCSSATECGLGTLYPGQSAIVTFHAQAGSGGSAQATIQVYSNVGNNDSDNTDNMVTASTTITNVANASLGIVPSASRKQGGTLTYYIGLSNAADATVGAMHVVNPVPDGLTGPSWTCTAIAGADCLFAAGTGGIDQDVEVPPGGMVLFALHGTVPTASGDVSVTDNASISLASGTNEGDSSATATVVVGIFADGFDGD